MKDCSELRRQRGVIIKNMRALTDRTDAEKRELTAEEAEQYARMESDQERLRVEIEREERQASLDKELESFDKEPGRMPEPEPGSKKNGNPRASEEYREQFADMLTRGYPLQSGIGASKNRILEPNADVQCLLGRGKSPEVYILPLIGG